MLWMGRAAERAAALSRGGGWLHLFALKREMSTRLNRSLSGFKKLWHHKGAGAGQGLASAG